MSEVFEEEKESFRWSRRKVRISSREKSKVVIK